MRRFKQGAFSVWPPSPYVSGWRPDLPCRAVDLDFGLPLALMFAREAGLRRIRPHLRRRGLTEAGWRILRVLESAGRRLTPTEIARLAGGTDTNARLAARRLAARGQVAWHDDPGPGRAVNDWRSGPWLGLAEAGEMALFRVHHACRVAWVDPGPRFPESRRRTLERALARLIRAAGASVPVALDPPPPHATGDDPPGWTQQAMHDLDLGLPLTLKHARAAVLAPVRVLLAEHGLSEPQWRCLRVLEFYDRPVAKKHVIRMGGFLGPEARHALAALMDRKLIDFDRAPLPPTTAQPSLAHRLGRERRRKRFPIALNGAGRDMILAVEDAEYARLGPMMVRVGAGAVLAMTPLLSELTRAWLWRPGLEEDADPHPLHAVYAQQEASAKETSARWWERRRAARGAVT